MVHGNDPLQSSAHSNGQAALPAHTHHNNQSPDRSDKDPPGLAAGSTNEITAGAGLSVPAPPGLDQPASSDKVLSSLTYCSTALGHFYAGQKG